MSKSITSRNKFSLLGCAAVAALATGMFVNISAALADDDATETVVVTGTRFNTDAAPAKASLDTKEPQTIINKPYIEDYLPPQSDYVTILSIAPSMTGGDINGPGLSDGGTKNTLRGLPDGNFVMQYDGIPFGDTNGPTHHNISYFPASTIGSAVVDRGPGNAGNLGASTYGGTIKLFSEDLTDDPHAEGVASYGSFGTVIGILNGQSGDLDTFGVGHVKVLVNLQDLQSNGALSGQDLYTKNALVKVQDEIAPHWTLTLFGDYSHLYENLDDNNGATPFQVYMYGKDFALQKTNPLTPTYAPDNYTTKQTDMEYLRENGEITNSLKVENTTYTYAYWNHTFSPKDQEQSALDYAVGPNVFDGEGAAPGGHALTFINPSTVDGFTPNANNDFLSYSKENAYRVYGDILRVTQDYDFGWISGEIRAGIWWEAQATHRFKYYYDGDQCAALGIDPYDVGDTAANAECGVSYRYSSNITKTKSAPNGDLGYAADDEHSDWNQYEPFVEVDIKPTDNLTLTPGVKFIHWDHGVDAAVEQGSFCGVAFSTSNSSCSNAPGQNYTAGFITRDTLPFVEVNYKIEPSWSVYAQYAQGIYIPDISAFEGNSNVGSGISPTNPNGFPAPETTTNYQVGTVYYSDNFTFDADVYYIPISNNEVAVACSYDPSDQCFENTGTATYKGIEGEGTYAFDELFDVDLRGLSVFANGAIMDSKSGGYWVANAPQFTAAGGFLYNQNGWKFSIIDKLVGSQFSNGAILPGDKDQEYSNDPRYRINSYGDLTGSLAYGFGMAELSLTADNLLDSRHTTLITINDAISSNGSGYETNRLDSLDQYFFQSPRSLMMALKVRY